jgi:hypothetical protein
MFSVTCPHLDHEVLVSYRQIHALTNTAHGIVLEFDCPCGARGVYLTGAAAGASELISHEHAQQFAEAV